jgi:hypothetical protein
VHLLVVLEEPGPELLLELLLAQHKCDIAAAVLDLGLLGVDLGEELKVDSVGDLFWCRGALEAELCGLQVELEVWLGNVGGDNGEEDVVLLSVDVGWALGPGNCEVLVVWIPSTRGAAAKQGCHELCEELAALAARLRGERDSLRNDAYLRG